MFKRAVISGGTQGLGRALSLVFAKNGFDVAALYHSNHVEAERLSQEFSQHGFSGRCICHDIAKEQFLIEESSDCQLVIIHNACPRFEPKPWHLWTWEEYEAQWMTAVRGAHHLVHPNINRILKMQRPVFAAILSEVIATQTPSKGFSGYAVAKKALEAWTQALGEEFKSRGLECHLFYPGYMQTPLTSSWHPQLRQMMGKVNASPGEVAQDIYNRVVKATHEID